MNESEIGLAWSKHFGLALAPLLEAGEGAGRHELLLDGGYGTFALSTDHNDIDPKTSAGWIWSSDVPHHVSILEKSVQVVRWDKPHQPETYTRVSVERELDRFYTYLEEDRVASNSGVVEHLLNFFRRLRSLTHDANLADSDTTGVFTAALTDLINRTEPRNGELSCSPASAEKAAALDKRGYEAALGAVSSARGSLESLRLYPELAVRHASGQIFQEAHFELMRVGTKDLFGLAGPATARAESRGGAHFTPPALARIIVEQAVKSMSDLSTRESLVLCDPACGSGAFLYEALRVLRRVGFNGRLDIVGRDVSNAAVAMALFVIKASLQDWTPQGGVKLDIIAGDSLAEAGIPAADLIVMNPPFISSVMQSPLQRSQLAAAIGPTVAARGDYSMAFITKALDALNSNGALGAVFPASLLSLKATAPWREWLAENGYIRLLGSIGDFGIFAQALVQVACAIVTKSPPSDLTAIGLLTGNDPNATGAAFRQLRRLEGLQLSIPIEESGWSVFPFSVSNLRARPTWKLLSPSDERVLRRAQDANLPNISDLFNMHQGIQTGNNSVFVINNSQFDNLLPREKKYFRLAVMTDSIQDGRFIDRYYLFYPHNPDGSSIFINQQEVEKALPTYFSRILIREKLNLGNRASIVRSQRNDWWGLQHPRLYTRDGKPKLVTKAYAATGGIIFDADGILFPVTAHVWIPSERLDPVNIDEYEMDIREILAAYTAFFNTRSFIRVLACFAPNVSGGQFDFGARHIDNVPVPDFRLLSRDNNWGDYIRTLSILGRDVRLKDREWRREAETISGLFYGSDAFSSED